MTLLVEDTFDKIIAEDRARTAKQDRLRNAIVAGADSTPEEAGAKIVLAGKAGLPSSLLDTAEAVNEVKGQVRRDSIPAAKLVGTKTGDWASQHPDNVSVAQNSFDPMLSTEDALKRAESERVKLVNANERSGNPLEHLGIWVAQGANSLAQVPMNIAEAVVGKFGSEDTLKGFQQYRQFVAPSTGPIGMADAVARRNLDIMKSHELATEDIFLSDPKTGTSTINWNAVNPFSTAGIHNISKVAVSESMPMVASLLLSEVSGGASLAPYLGKLEKLGKAAPFVQRWAHFATTPVAALEVARTTSGIYDDGVQHLMNKGMTQSEAGAAAAPGALLAGIFSFMAGAPLESKFVESLSHQMTKLNGGFGIAKRIQAWAREAGAKAFQEGTQEVANGIGEDLAKWITYQPELTLKEAAANAVMNFAGGAALGGGMSAGTHGRSSTLAAKQQDFINALHDTAKRSELAKVAPSKMNEWIAEITKGGTLENISLPARDWQTYWQTEGEAKAVEMGVSPEAYKVAVAGGSDITIPTKEFASKIAGTEHFDALFPSIRSHEGGPTFQETKQAKAKAESTTEINKLLAELPESSERSAIREQIVKDLTLAQGAIKGEKDIAAVADSYAKVIMVAAERAKVPAQKILEENRLKITQGFQDTLDNMGGKDVGLDGNLADPEVQGSAAGGKQAGVVGGSQAVRGRLPGQGASPTERNWHGTEAKPEVIAALKAEGLSRNGAGGMGGGLHLSAGPDVAVKYAKGNKDGIWKASIRDLVPFDASLDTSHGQDVLKFLEVTSERDMTGSEVWDRLVRDLGSEEAAQKHLEGKGFNGLFYNHGGEDAWAVWHDKNIQGSRLTTEAQARAEYASQGSWRDPLTGFLKEVAQITLESAPGSVSPLVGYDKLKPAKQAQYHAEKMAAAARALEAAGIQVRSTTTGNGYWGGESNLVTRLVVRPDKIQEAARIVADVVNDQEGVGWNRAVKKGTQNAVWLRFDRPLTKAEVVKIGKALEASGLPVFPDNSKPDELKVIGYAAVDLDALHEVVESSLPEGLSPTSAHNYIAESNVEERGHGTDDSGSGSAANAGRRSQVQRSIVNGRAEIATINQRYGLGQELQQSVTLREGTESLAPYGIEPGKRYTIREIAQALEERQRDLYGTIAKDDRSDEAAARIADWMVAEVAFELGAANSGVGWYSVKFNNAIDHLAQTRPELKSSLTARGLFTVITAITSDGAEVMDNLKMATELYDSYKASGDFTKATGHNRESANNLSILKGLIEKHGEQGALDFLRQEKTVAELGKIARKEGMKFSTDYLAAETMPMAALVLGPKVGVFFANLSGMQGYLTMDRWWSRTFNRYRAQVIPEVTDSSWKNLREKLGKPKLSFEKTLEEATKLAEAAKAKKWKGMTDLERMGNTVWKMAYGTLEDAPFSSSDRSFMIKSAKLAQQKMAAMGQPMTTADIQATLWYYEKRLYGELGGSKKSSKSISYEDAAKTLFQGNMPGAVTVNGVHYSPQTGLTELDPTKYGTGSAGAESKRLRGLPQEDRNRTFLYEVKDGVVPPKEAVVRGQNKYTAQISNVYDLDQDVLGLRGSSQDLNELERTLREQGYRGYVATAPGMDARGIVLLGAQKTAVKALPDPDQVTVLYQPGGEYDGDAHFSAGALQNAYDDARGRSRHTVVHMSPQDFLKMAAEGHDSDKEQTVNGLVSSGTPFNSVPHISIEKQKDGEWKVVGHEGRHRSRALAALGVTSMPVRVTAREGGGTLRWNESPSEQPKRVKSEDGRALVSFPSPDASILFQPDLPGPRGALRYTGPQGNRDFNMALLKNQNKSTVMHELGHFYLEIIGDLATQPGSDQQIKDDYAKILKWFGVNDRSEITVAHHEKFADAHLLYLLEGKAPVKELVPAFKRFSNWLAKIGQKLIAADVEINDDVRGIFDRLYATEQELANAQQQMPELFTTAEQLGISQAEFNLLAKEKAKAIDEAHERVTRQVMRELASEDREEYQNAKKSITEAVTEEVDAMPEYQALAALKTAEPTMKINRGLAEDLYGKDKVATLPKDLLHAEGGLDPDAAATIYGFPSGDAMVDAMTSLPARGKAISLEVQSRLDMTFPSMKDTGELRVRAVEALNGDRKGDVLAAELKIFEKNADKVLAPTREAQAEKQGKQEARGQNRVKTIREAAKRHVASLPISRINPFQYFQAQQSASKKAFDAALNKDWTTAAREKERELLNHFLFLESLKIKEASEDFRDWVAKNDSSRVRAKIAQAGGDFLAQFDALRDRFGIDRLPNKAVEKKLALGQWVEEMTAEGMDVVIDPELLDESRTKNYREMTMPEMKGVWDALKNIKHLAYAEYSTVINGKRVERAQMVDEIDAAARANNVTREQLRSTDPKRDRAGHRAEAWLRGKDALMVKMESVFNWIDGGDVNGPAHRYIFNRLADAQTHEYTLQKEITGKLVEVMESIPKEQRTKDKDNVEIEGFGTATKGELMTMLLYWGQDVRREKLLSGYATRGLTEEGLLAAFDQYLTAADIALANQIWASFGTISQDVRELEKRLTGVMPDFDAATPFSIKAGALTGGYMPLVADRAISGELGKKQEGGPLGDLFGNGYVRAKTSTSHVKEITGAVYPLSLDYHSILTAGLANQIKDLTHREAVLDIRRLFMNKKFQDAVKESIGEDYEAQLMPWLANIVNERNAGASQGLQKFSSFLTALRANTVAAMLGFKFTTTVIQVLDAPRALLPGEGQVKGRFAASALFKTLENPVKAWEMITEKSGEMRFRADNLDRDIRQQLQKMTGDLSLKAKTLRWGFVGLSVMDKISSRLVWLGSYQQALAAGKDEHTSILEADKTVRLRLMSGNPKDLIAIQRGNDALKLVTMFLGDATANYNVLRNLGHDIRGFKGVPTLAMSAVVMMSLQVMAELIKGQGPDDDDDAAAWVARKAMLTPASNVPILRDFANALDGALSGNPIKAEYRFTPVVQMFQKVIQGVQSSVKMAQGEEELEDWMIKTGSALGYAVGIPGTSQAEASAKYLRRYQQGEESPDNVLALVGNTVRGKKRER